MAYKYIVLKNGTLLFERWRLGRKGRRVVSCLGLRFCIGNGSGGGHEMMVLLL